MPNLRVQNYDKALLISHLNINSTANKFDQLKSVAENKSDVLVLNEIKIDLSYLTQQFHRNGFSKP